MTLYDDFLSDCLKKTYDLKAPEGTCLVALSMFDRNQKIKHANRKWTLVALWSILPLTTVTIYLVTLFTDFDPFYIMRRAFSENIFLTLLDILILTVTIGTIFTLLFRLLKMRMLVLGK